MPVACTAHTVKSAVRLISGATKTSPNGTASSRNSSGNASARGQARPEHGQRREREHGDKRELPHDLHVAQCRASSQPAPAAASGAAPASTGVRRQRAEHVAPAPDQPQADRQDSIAVGEGFGAVPDRDHRFGGAQIQARRARAAPATISMALERCQRGRSGVQVAHGKPDGGVTCIRVARSMRARLRGQL